jgi:hypothetical protein
LGGFKRNPRNTNTACGMETVVRVFIFNSSEYSVRAAVVKAMSNCHHQGAFAVKHLLGFLVLCLCVACAAPQSDPVDFDDGSSVSPTSGLETVDENGVTTVVTEAGLLNREPDTCGALAHQTAIGQSEFSIPTLGITHPVRILRPDSIVTQEYNPHRVNFAVDVDGTIQSIRCG